MVTIALRRRMLRKLRLLLKLLTRPRRLTATKARLSFESGLENAASEKS